MRSNRAARNRIAPRDDGQIMLLTAFVIVIAFVALTAMVARVNQLPDVTRKAGEQPLLNEAEALATGMEQMMQDLNVIIGPRADGQNMTVYHNALANATLHLETLESSRGFNLRMNGPPLCDASSGSAVMAVPMTLGDGNTRVALNITYTPKDIWTQTDPLDEWNSAAWADGKLGDDDDDITVCVG